MKEGRSVAQIDAEVELKRTTADRLIAYRSRSGAGGLRALAARCRGIHAETLHRMCMRERFPIRMWRAVSAALDEIEKEDNGDEN